MMQAAERLMENGGERGDRRPLWREEPVSDSAMQWLPGP